MLEMGKKKKKKKSISILLFLERPAPKLWLRSNGSVTKKMNLKNLHKQTYTITLIQQIKITHLIVDKLVTIHCSNSLTQGYLQWLCIWMSTACWRWWGGHAVGYRQHALWSQSPQCKSGVGRATAPPQSRCSSHSVASDWAEGGKRRYWWATKTQSYIYINHIV